MEFLPISTFFRFRDEINIQKSVNLTMMDLPFFQTGEFEVLAGESISIRVLFYTSIPVCTSKI